MDKIQKQALQVAKEIVVKFIEVGRISPSNFSEHFNAIHADVVASIVEQENKLAGDGALDGNGDAR
ncbi:hypothetical protein [Maridesulfovibrio salexigens]|uniref:Conjugal transfer protein TraB n=1 Tax=Maridesulfovibrio salexigens (strain ATCC 14822 / DSM 2638 / NCIMB 8403 / VKM B-1763) TaxID=526222 RepID=C6BZ00_MARSD|nr:hypothetical protein [Maridesulfovibrio salexigens]ACS78824.1 hypothetical protein Desal_0758 [Maridesulfovibrio salexigens DSM 2638]